MIICVVGPTGVGKTKLSVALAKKYHAIVVNCDAMQVYQELNIGTAKPTKEEQEGIPHFLFDFVPVSQNYTVYDYQKDARKIIDKYKKQNIIFVGGTGLYLKAALFDYRFSEDNHPKKGYSELSTEDLYNLALIKDKNVNIHPHNRQRLVRFLNKESITYVEPKPLYSAIFIGLTTNRDNLYQRIDKRVDEMFKMGLLDEVKVLYDEHITGKSINTAIGYKELYDYFNGQISLVAAQELIKKRSRNYAKRQYTWFKHQLPVQWFETDYSNFSNTINEVINSINKRNY
jgi:tRNA dimethylallyltransferase